MIIVTMEVLVNITTIVAVTMMAYKRKSMETVGIDLYNKLAS